MFEKLKRIFSKEDNEPRQKHSNPEDDFIVTITEELVKVEHSTQKTELIRWVDINEIWLINTDDGPIFPDVWLALCGEKDSCLIPQGSKGFQEVYDIVSKYERFNFENFIVSMSCTDNQRFILWKRNEID